MAVGAGVVAVAVVAKRAPVDDANGGVLYTRLKMADFVYNLGVETMVFSPYEGVVVGCRRRKS